MSEQQLMHQRNLLSNMGIDLWIPKDALVCENSASDFWRDQVVYENTTINLEESTSEQIIDDQENICSFEQVPNISITHGDVNLKLESNTLSEEKGTIEPFVLSAFVSRKIIIFMNAQDLVGEERQLLNNIVMTLDLSQYDLRWPIWESLQDQNCLSAYIQGFIDIQQYKKDTPLSKIILGQQPKGLWLENIQEFASLKEMFETPKKKKLLWDYLKSV